MLVLTRKTDERITIGDTVDVVVLSIRGNRVRLGITAPADTAITRGPADQPVEAASAAEHSCAWARRAK
jgi:carbon storage regulator